MRLLAILLTALLLSGCQGRPVFCEHSNEASMQHAMAFHVFVIEPDGQNTSVLCRLPQDIGMEQILAERFLAENEALIGNGVSAEVSMRHDVSVVDIGRLPTFENAGLEEGFLNAMVMTMRQLPTVERVRFLFDGLELAELPHGTRCFNEFPVDETD